MNKPQRPSKYPSQNKGEDDPIPFPNSDLPPHLQRTIYRKLQEEAGGDGDLGEVDETAFKEALREAEREKQRKREKPLKINGSLNDVLKAAMRPKKKSER